MSVKRLFSMVLATSLIIGSVGLMPEADAKHGHYKHGKYRGDNGNHYGWQNNRRNAYYDRRRHAWVDYKTGKIIKGGLIGAGIGAGAGLLLDKNVGKTALVGAGVGAGTQAVRYSRTLRRHPIVKTGAYGALAGAGVSAVTNRTSLGKGALWGGAIGTGVGALRHLD